MVEQIGSIFLEGPGGLLYPPNFADVIVRDPETWEPAANGQPGVIQVLSLLPHSYPGHSLLTEDTGVIEAVDPGNGGWMGKGIGSGPRRPLGAARVQRRNRGGVMALVWSPQARDGRRLRAGRAHRSHDLFGCESRHPSLIEMLGALSRHLLEAPFARRVPQYVALALLAARWR